MASTSTPLPSASASCAAEDEAIEAELTRLVGLKEALSKRELELEKRAAALAARSATSKPEPLLYLNIGGMSYHTMTSNLTKIRGSRLEILLSGRHEVKKDEKQDYFIDRDGPLFKYVLNYLRDSRVEEPTDETERRLLKQEFEYYGISISSAAPVVNVPRESTTEGQLIAKDNVYSLLRAKEARLKEREVQLKHEEDAYEEEKAIVVDANKRTADKVTLNVSGTSIAASRTTLCFAKDSMLSAMFTEGTKHTLVRDREGKIFLDQDTDRFRLVLNALRNASEDLPVIATPQLKSEMEKLCIMLPKELFIGTCAFRTGPRYTLSNSNQRATKEGSEAWDATILSEDALGTCREIRIRYMTTGDNGVMIGIAPSSIDTSADNNYTLSGCYLFVHQSQSQYYHKSSATCGTPINQRIVRNVPQEAWIRLDQVARTISYCFTNPPSNWHIAYKDVDCSQPLHLCILLVCPGSWVEIVES